MSSDGSLTQEEIDALLSISDSDLEASLAEASDCRLTEDEIDQALGFDLERKKRPRIYDFRRPEMFAKENTRVLQMMHELFARLCTVVFTQSSRAYTAFFVGSVDQLTYEEFIRSIPNPACCAIINMDPFKSSAVIEIDPAITRVILDTLMGGEAVASQPPQEYKMSEIDLSIMEGMIVRMLGQLREAWAPIIDLRPRLGNIETNPIFCQIEAPNEMCVLITIETKIGEVEGMVNICYPARIMKDVLGKLTSEYYYHSYMPEDRKLIETCDIPVRTTNSYPQVFITLEALLNLRRGDVIPIENTVTTKYHGQTVTTRAAQGSLKQKRSRYADLLTKNEEELTTEEIDEMYGLSKDRDIQEYLSHCLEGEK